MRKKPLTSISCFLQLRCLLMNNYKLELFEYKEPKMSGNNQQNEAGPVQGNVNGNEVENVQILPKIPEILDGGNMKTNFPSILVIINLLTITHSR